MVSTFTRLDTEHRAQTARQREQVLGVRIAGTGSYVPDNIVRNEDLTALGCDADWIVQRTGIRERRHALPHQATSDLAFEAANRCLQNAELEIDQIDLIIMGTMTPDYAAPNASCLLQDRLGAECGALDINAACSGFMYSLITASQFVKTGCCRNVLVVGADIMSHVVNPEDKKTYPLFGDAAGAVVVSPSIGNNGSGTQGILSYCLGADGDKGQHLKIPCSGSRERLSVAAIEQGRHLLAMDGRPVFKWAVRKIGESIRKVLNQASLTTEDIDLLVLHQANVRIIDAAVQDLELPPEKVFVNLEKYGNTSAGSIPLALDEINRKGQLNAGDKVVLCGFGAGLTWGACVIEW